MDTRKIATEYRLSHWAEILRERQESGESIKRYCARLKIKENTYYYWQKRLRETACQGLMPAIQSTEEVATVPRGWAICAQEKKATTDAKVVVIEIGKCRVEATQDTSTDLLMKVCRALMSIC